MNKETLPQIGVSETLRMARERTGQDLRFVADMLRIRYAYLEAIENGEYQKLPGAPYAIGFVRAYADHLNLNSVEIVERFKRERADLDQQTQLVFPKPLPEGKVPSGGILLVAVILGVFVYGAWFFLSGQDKPIVELIPEIPARLMALVGAGDDDTAEPADAGPAETGADADETMAVAPTDDPATDDTSADLQVAPGPVGDADPAETPAAPRDAAATGDDDPAAPATSQETGTAAVSGQSEPATSGPAAEEPATPALPAVEPPTAEPRETAASPSAPAAVEPTEPGAETAESAATPVAPEPDEPSRTADAPADTPPTVAETDPVAEPDGAAEADAAVAVEDGTGVEPEEADVATAPEPDESDVQAPGAGEPADAEEDDAAAIAQRVLEELAQPADEPAAAPGARVNGDSGTAASRTETPSEEVPVAAITPAARPSEAEAPSETPAVAAPGEGAGAVTPAIMAARSGGKIYGDENEESRILITARVDSWVEVSTRQGELLLTRVLRAGDSFRVPDRDGLSLQTGNAGGLAISVDGNQVPDLGPVGAVRRGVELDPDRLIAGTAGNL